MSRKWLLFLTLFAVSIVLDQATKIWVYTNLEYARDAITVIPGLFEIVHAQNPGALNGFLRDSPYRLWVFSIFTVVAMGVILQMLWQLPDDDRFQATTLGLIAGGAVGNAIDRLHKGTVTDFLRIYTENETLAPWLKARVGMAEWPSFNVADMALVIGVALFLVHYIFLEEAPGPESEGAPEPASAP